MSRTVSRDRRTTPRRTSRADRRVLRRPRRRRSARHQRPGTPLRLRAGAPRARHASDGPCRRPVAAGPRPRLAHRPAAAAADEHGGLAGDPVHRRERGLLGPDTPGAEPARVGGDGELGPDDYPTRAQYGRYLEWVFGEVVREAPPARAGRGAHRPRATRLDDARRRPPDRSHSTTAAPCPASSAVVLAQGHLPAVADPAQQRLTAYADRHGLRHVPPANPADVDLSAARPRRAGPAARSRPQLLRPHGAVDDGPRRPFRPRTAGRPALPPLGRRAAPVRRLPPRHPVPGPRRQREGPVRPSPARSSSPPEVIAGFRKRADSGDAPDFLRGDMAAGGEGGGNGLLRGRCCGRERRSVRTGRSSGRGFLALVAAPRAPKRPLSWTSSGSRPPTAGPGTGFRGRTPDSVFAGPDDCRDWLLDHLREDAEQAALGNVDGPAQGRPRRAARPAQRAAADRRPRRAVGRLAPGPPGPLVHAAQRVPVHRPAPAAHRGDDRADRGGRAGRCSGPRLEVRAEDGAWVAHSPDVPGLGRDARRRSSRHGCRNRTCGAPPTNCSPGC